LSTELTTQAKYAYMRDAGMYTQLWKKYLPVIRLLLKKTVDGEQKLQIYKHEFESTGARNKLGYVFSLELVNGKPINKSAATAVASDLYGVLSSNEAVAEWLKDQNIKISVGRSCELVMQKFEKVVKVVAPEPVASA
jgi:hypothetical protein